MGYFGRCHKGSAGGSEPRYRQSQRGTSSGHGAWLLLPYGGGGRERTARKEIFFQRGSISCARERDYWASRDGDDFVGGNLGGNHGGKNYFPGNAPQRLSSGE